MDGDSQTPNFLLFSVLSPPPGAGQQGRESHSTNRGNNKPITYADVDYDKLDKSICYHWLVSTTLADSNTKLKRAEYIRQNLPELAAYRVV